MSKQSIKTTIDANIKQNGVQAITGQIMNSVLTQMVNNLAEEAGTTERFSELEDKMVEQIDGDGNADVNITDEEGHIIMSLIKGAIKTKGFDSRQVGFEHNILLDGIFLVRDNCGIVNGSFEDVSGKYCSNRIGCKNANYIRINDNDFDKIVLFDLLGGYIETTDRLIELDGKYESFIIQSSYNSCSICINYSQEDDVDMIDYPLYFRVPVNQVRFNASTESFSYDHPLAVCHIAKHFSSKRTTLLNGGYGKSLTIDGWKSTANNEQWISFIREMQSTDFNVISVEGGRKITTSDVYRSGAGYVMPSLGNPLLVQAINKAHEKCCKMLGLSERVSIVGASQGGILAYNYPYLRNGAISSIVVLAGLTRLKEDGWERQPADVQAYFNEWYGITSYSESVVNGFDPYRRIVGGKLYCYPPIRCVYGSADTTALLEPAQEVVNAVKSAGGLAEMRVIEGGTHSSVAGVTDNNVVKLAIGWLERFN